MVQWLAQQHGTSIHQIGQYIPPSDIVVVVVGVGVVYSGHVVCGHVVGSIDVVVHGGHSSDVVVVVG